MRRHMYMSVNSITLCFKLETLTQQGIKITSMQISDYPYKKKKNKKKNKGENATHSFYNRLITNSVIEAKNCIFKNNCNIEKYTFCNIAFCIWIQNNYFYPVANI